jgi:hypothetical protein
MKILRSIFILIACAGIILTSSCNKGSQEKEEGKSLYENLEDKDGADASAPDSTQTTEITFAETTFDFGVINKGQMVTHPFKFTNTGKAPLIITSATASCGCTVPSYPKDPILPGQTGEIKVQYNGSGTNQIEKTVTVVANTNPPDSKLTIKAFVLSEDAKKQ